ncbi:MAG TPA: hypothetical protein VG937_05950 [Polyangiaceae bacterium]|nr:hypothetical protein [Polyangiaceae bacterium]
MRALFSASPSALFVATMALLPACGSRSALSLVLEELGSGGTPGSGGSAPTGDVPRLCVFDYDLTLSSHSCPETDGRAAYFCRQNRCDTYGWFSQCLAPGARAAVAECVRRGAFIGIASHASVDPCWSDKVLPIVAQQQFPELTGAPNYARPDQTFSYPAIDVRENWNCETCAYTMDGTLSKPNGIRRVMRHYGLDPSRASDRARVIFWDDTPSNISAVAAELPEARRVLVPRFTNNGADGGCGLTERDIQAGWAP